VNVSAFVVCPARWVEPGPVRGLCLGQSAVLAGRAERYSKLLAGGHRRFSIDHVPMIRIEGKPIASASADASMCSPALHVRSTSHHTVFLKGLAVVRSVIARRPGSPDVDGLRIRRIPAIGSQGVAQRQIMGQRSRYGEGAM
jgi:hypothetical protein